MKTFNRFFIAFFSMIMTLGLIGCTNNSTTSGDKENAQQNELGTLQGDLLGDEALPSEETDPVDGSNDVGVNDYLFGSKYGNGGNYSTN